jgi:hypothetical protein
MGFAELFDEPVDASGHTFLREEGWMGGDLVEGRYLLGMLLGANLFRLSHDQYAARLHRFLSEKVSPSAAEIFGNLAQCRHVIPYLRRLYREETTYPPLPLRNDREEAAVTYLLHNLDATDADLAAALGTTVKQIGRMACLTAVKAAIWNHRR